MSEPCLSPQERLVRSLNRCNGSTALGLLVARLGSAHVRQGPRGLFVADGYRLPVPSAGAFTVGNVVLICGGKEADLTANLPEVMDHEYGHSVQWAYCLGLAFLPLYLCCAGWSWLRTGNPGMLNFFEREADLERGGYPNDLPVRSVRQGLAAAFAQVRAPQAR